MKVLPINYLKCLSAADRKVLGKAGVLPKEADDTAIAKSEKELQKQIINILRLRGIEVNVSRMDKRKTDRVGWPDLVFSVANSRNQIFPCAWEIKLPKNVLSEAQRKTHRALLEHPNAWNYRVIFSVDDALWELKDMRI